MAEPTTAAETLWRRGSVAALVVLVAAIYWPALQFDFVRWDDPVNVTQNPLLTEPWSWSLAVKLFNGDTALRFKPLTWLIYRGMFAGFGFNPQAWHALGLLLHLGATVLFWQTLRAMLERFRPHAKAGGWSIAALAGALAWAVHPARVEPVCWVTATPYPLLAVCLLSSFLFYHRASGSPGGISRRRDFALAWIFAVLGYATYPVGVTYGLWLMAADIWIFRTAPDLRGERTQVWRWLGRHAVFLLPAVVSMVITWSSSSTTPWLYPAPPSFAEVGLLVRLKMGAAMLAAVGTHFVWPVALTPNNPMLTPERIAAPLIPAFATATLLLLTAAWLWRSRRPAVTGVVFGCALLALPVLGLGQWPSWSVADRHVYLPHLVLTGAVVLAAVPRDPTSGRRRPFALAGIALIVVLGVLARRQVMIWRNTDTLFTYIEAQPAFAWNAHQQAYVYSLWSAHAQEAGRTRTARSRLDQARRALQQGMLAAAQDRAWTEAVDLARQLERQFGLPPVFRRERARWLLELDQPREAGADLLRARREMPDDAETEALLARCRNLMESRPKTGK